MGGSQSVKSYVESLASTYRPYGQDLEGVTVKFLLSLSPEDFEETLDDLSVTNRLHRRILRHEWQELCQKSGDDDHSITEVTYEETEVSESEDPVVLEETECTKPIYQSDLQKRRPSAYPINPPEDIRCLELFQEELASPEDAPHIPPSIWDLNHILGADPTPIHKDDIEREALLAELGFIKDLSPNDPVGIAIQQLCKMSVKIFDLPIVTVSIPTRDQDIILGASYDTPTSEQHLAEGFETLVFNDDGTPFMSRMKNGRGTAICNYPIYTKATFVVRDMWKDKSFQSFANGKGARFYAGVPLFYQGEAIAVFAMMSMQDRPDFSVAQEMQMEQIAALVSQQIELWALKKEVSEIQDIQITMEARRRPPEEKAALVNTDIEGSTRMWEENPEAMSQLLQLHDEIMRKTCADFCGYEIVTEGDAFHIAFHEAVDAVAFCLAVQERLHDAY